MKLTGTVLRCSARKVNSSSKETYVTNLLVLDPENEQPALIQIRKPFIIPNGHLPRKFERYARRISYVG